MRFRKISSDSNTFSLKNLFSFRNRKSKALQEEKDHLEQFFASGKVGLWEWSLDRGFEVKDRWARLNGGKDDIYFLSNEQWMKLIHPEDIASVKQEVQALRTGVKCHYQMQYRIRVGDGSYKWLLSSGNVTQRNRQNRALKAVGTHLDITKEKEQEEKVLLQAHLLELVEDGIIALNTEGNISCWSKGAEKLFGLAENEVMGKALSQVLTIRKRLPNEKASLFKFSDGWKGKALVEAKSRQSVPVYIDSSEIISRTGDKMGYVLHAKDLTQIAQVQQQLIEQQAFIVSVMESSAELIFALNAKHELLYFNSGVHEFAQKLLGVPLKIGDRLDKFMDARQGSILNNNWQEVLAGRRPNYDFQHTFENAECQFFEVYISPIFSHEQEIIGLTYNLRNVTERKQAELEMKRLEKEMYHNRLREQKIRTAAMMEGQELERKRLARELHDGLGQMLNVLKIQMNLGVPESSRMLDEILEEVIRINNNLMPRVLQDFGLEAGLRQLIEQFDQISEEEIYYYSELQEQRLPSSVEIGIYRIIQEALNNAVKYAQASQISVQLTLHKDTLLVMIEDDGVGFDFKQVEQNDQKSYGLLNLQSRAEALGGELTIDSQKGKGTLVTIELAVSL